MTTVVPATVSAAVVRTLAVYRQRLAMFLGLAVMGQAPGLICRAWVEYRRNVSTTPMSLGDVVIHNPWLLLPLFVGLAASFWGTLAIYEGASRTLQLEQTSAAQCLKTTRKTFWPFVAWKFSLGFLMGAAAALLLWFAGGFKLLLAMRQHARIAPLAKLTILTIPLVLLVLQVLFGLFGVVLIAEAARTKNPLLRSQQLVKEHFWRSCGLYLLIVIAPGLLTYLTSLAEGNFYGASKVLWLILYPLYPISAVVWYYALRGQHETASNTHPA